MKGKLVRGMSVRVTAKVKTKDGQAPKGLGLLAQHTRMDIFGNINSNGETHFNVIFHRKPSMACNQPKVSSFIITLFITHIFFRVDNGRRVGKGTPPFY